MIPTPTGSAPDNQGPCPARGEIRVINGNRCRFIERELEGDKWEVLGPDDGSFAALIPSAQTVKPAAPFNDCVTFQTTVRVDGEYVPRPHSFSAMAMPDADGCVSVEIAILKSTGEPR